MLVLSNAELAQIIRSLEHDNARDERFVQKSEERLAELKGELDGLAVRIKAIQPGSSYRNRAIRHLVEEFTGLVDETQSIQGCIGKTKMRMRDTTCRLQSLRVQQRHRHLEHQKQLANQSRV